MYFVKIFLGSFCRDYELIISYMTPDSLFLLSSWKNTLLEAFFEPFGLRISSWPVFSGTSPTLFAFSCYTFCRFRVANNKSTGLLVEALQNDIHVLLADLVPISRATCTQPRGRFSPYDISKQNQLCDKG